jgi:rhodanese-related sulfurtransferase
MAFTDMRNLCSFLLLIWVLFSGLSMADEMLGQLTPEQLQTLQATDTALIVDVRTAPEWQATGVVPGSQKLTFFDKDGNSNPEQWLKDLEKLKSSPEQPVILVCRSGNRSSKVGAFLLQRGMKNVSHLNGGIQGWLKAGRTLQKECQTVACANGQ